MAYLEESHTCKWQLVHFKFKELALAPKIVCVVAPTQ